MSKADCFKNVYQDGKAIFTYGHMTPLPKEYRDSLEPFTETTPELVKKVVMALIEDDYDFLLSFSDRLLVSDIVLNYEVCHLLRHINGSKIMYSLFANVSKYSEVFEKAIFFRIRNSLPMYEVEDEERSVTGDHFYNAANDTVESFPDAFADIYGDETDYDKKRMKVGEHTIKKYEDDLVDIKQVVEENFMSTWPCYNSGTPCTEGMPEDCPMTAYVGQERFKMPAFVAFYHGAGLEKNTGEDCCYTFDEDNILREK